MRNREEIPLFEAEDRAGRRSGTLAAWQHKDMLVFVPHAACPRCDEVARRLSDPPPQLRGAEVALIALAPGGGFAELPWGVADPEGARGARLKAAAHVEEGTACALVADRFAELFAVIDLHSLPPGELLAELESWVDAVARQCGECSRM